MDWRWEARTFSEGAGWAPVQALQVQEVEATAQALVQLGACGCGADGVEVLVPLFLG